MNGANMNDIVRLKYKNMDSDFITFVRRKTQKTCKSPKPISVPVTEDMTEKQVRRSLDKLIKRTNDNIKKIAKEVGIEKTVTTYTARHSFYNVLKRSGVSTKFISESLGHNDLHFILIVLRMIRKKR